MDITINGIGYDFYKMEGMENRTYFHWKGKWSYGQCYFRGTVIKCTMCEHTFYTDKTPESCIKLIDIENKSLTDLSMGHDCALRFESIDEALEFLLKPVKKSDYEDRLKSELEDRQYELNKICQHITDLDGGINTRAIFRECEQLYLIENLIELIMELEEVNTIAKEHNVTFEWI